MFCFTLFLRAIFEVQAPGGLYLEGRFNEGFFCVTGLGGLYLGGGGAYTWRGLFRNFTVVLLTLIRCVVIYPMQSAYIERLNNRYQGE